MVNIIISYCEVAYAESFNLASDVFDSFTYIFFKPWVAHLALLRAC